MWLPFRSKWEELLQGDHPLWFKLGIGAAVGALAAASMLLEIHRGPPRGELTILTTILIKLAMVLLFAGLGALGVSVLTLKDAIQLKADRGDRLSYLTRLYFWKGGWSY